MPTTPEQESFAAYFGETYSEFSSNETSIDAKSAIYDVIKETARLIADTTDLWKISPIVDAAIAQIFLHLFIAKNSKILPGFALAMKKEIALKQKLIHNFISASFMETIQSDILKAIEKKRKTPSLPPSEDNQLSAHYKILPVISLLLPFYKDISFYSIPFSPAVNPNPKEFIAIPSSMTDPSNLQNLASSILQRLQSWQVSLPSSEELAVIKSPSSHSKPWEIDLYQIYQSFDLVQVQTLREKFNHYYQQQEGNRIHFAAILLLSLLAIQPSKIDILTPYLTSCISTVDDLDFYLNLLSMTVILNDHKQSPENLKSCILSAVALAENLNALPIDVDSQSSTACSYFSIRKSLDEQWNRHFKRSITQALEQADSIYSALAVSGLLLAATYLTTEAHFTADAHSERKDRWSQMLKQARNRVIQLAKNEILSSRQVTESSESAETRLKRLLSTVDLIQVAQLATSMNTQRNEGSLAPTTDTARALENILNTLNNHALRLADEQAATAPSLALN